MYQALAPCPACRRHVRATESARACPFCGETLGAAQTVPSAAGRLARGAAFVFASSVIAGCSGSTTEAPVVTDTGSLDTGGVAPAYGAPADTGIVDDGTVDDTGGTMAKYGAPPIPDASSD